MMKSAGDRMRSVGCAGLRRMSGSGRKGKSLERFVDRSRIVAVGGQGGSGCVSFFRDTTVMWGGPDGGRGGKGGSVWVEAVSNMVDLARDRHTYVGGHGVHGMGGGKHGMAGDDITIYVPVGTLVKLITPGAADEHHQFGHSQDIGVQTVTKMSDKFEGATGRTLTLNPKP
jgi:GTPase involved in cell partitioning and DNA repair